MLIICAGLKRAGSTLQYQLCKEILHKNYSIIDYGYTNNHKDISRAFKNKNDHECNVIKTHGFFNILKDYSKEKDVYILSSYRDLRDSSLSQIFAYNKTFSQLIKSEWLQDEMNTYYKLKKIENLLMQDFDVLKQDLKVSIFQISKYLNIKLDEGTAIKIANNFNIKSQKQKIKKYTKTKKYKYINFLNKIIKRVIPASLLQAGLILNIDKSTYLHHNHINSQKVDWQNFYSIAQKEEIKSIISDWLIELGYEKDANW
jgi:hypothetical protein